MRILTAAGLSDPISLPPDVFWYGPGCIPLEWGNELLLASRLRSGSIYELQNGKFVRMTPESPVMAAASYPVAQVLAAGNRLFTAADGWNVYMRGPSGWVETTGITGSAGAGSYLMGAKKTFAIRGAALFGRETEGWAWVPPPPHPKASTVTVVWQDRPVVLDESPFPGYALLAYDPTSDSWADLVFRRDSVGRRWSRETTFMSEAPSERSRGFETADGTCFPAHPLRECALRAPRESARRTTAST